MTAGQIGPNYETQSGGLPAMAPCDASHVREGQSSIPDRGRPESSLPARSRAAASVGRGRQAAGPIAAGPIAAGLTKQRTAKAVDFMELLLRTLSVTVRKKFRASLSRQDGVTPQQELTCRGASLLGCGRVCPCWQGCAIFITPVSRCPPCCRRRGLSEVNYPDAPNKKGSRRHPVSGLLPRSHRNCYARKCATRYFQATPRRSPGLPPAPKLEGGYVTVINMAGAEKRS